MLNPNPVDFDLGVNEQHERDEREEIEDGSFQPWCQIHITYIGWPVFAWID
jgi:hypothetical protein